MHVVVFESGEEAVSGLLEFARSRGIKGASFTAIGAFEGAELSFFDRRSKRYEPIPVEEQTEVLSFIGDIALADEAPKVHVHAVLGRRDGSCVGGDLKMGRVWPTLEVVVRETPMELRRELDPESGLPLITGQNPSDK